MANKICPQCGTEQDEKFKFCKNCGTLLSNGTKKNIIITEENNTQNNNDKNQKSTFDDFIKEEKDYSEAFINDDIDIGNNYNVRTCPRCGEKVENGDYCMHCGYKITQNQSEFNKTKFCQNCGTEFDSNASYCPKCGTSTIKQPQHNQTQTILKSKKIPILAVIFSFFLPGLGHAYLGLMKKGIMLFILAMLGGLLMAIAIGYIIWFAVWAYALYDGFVCADKMNKGIEVEDTLDFHNLF